MPTHQERPQPAWHRDARPLHQSRSDARRTIARKVLVVLAAVILASVLAGSPVLAAQTDDGTGAAIPGPPSDCVIPQSAIDLTATPTAIPSPTPSPTPVPTARIGRDASPVASPVASPASGRATPAGTGTPAAIATPAVDPLTAELLSASTTITSCLSERNVEIFTAITTDVYRGQQFGTDAPIPAEVYAQLAPTLLPIEYRIVDLRDITVVDADTVTTLVTYTAAYQLRTNVWAFRQDRVDGLLAWVLADEEGAAVRIPDGAVTLDLAIQDNAYTLSSDEAASANVALNLSNLDGVDHEALVLRLPEGTGSEMLLENPGPALPDGVAFIGQATVPAGAEGVLVLANLPSGTYTIVCLLPDEDGLPYLSSGMETTFTVK